MAVPSWIFMWNDMWDRYYLFMEIIMEKNKKIFTHCFLAILAGLILSTLVGCAATTETVLRDSDSNLTIGTGIGVGGEFIYESN